VPPGFSSAGSDKARTDVRCRQDGHRLRTTGGGGPGRQHAADGRIGVVHSHTHSEPYPSPTDVAQAPDPGWHYVIVSLKRGAPESRSYRIVDGTIS
jgi:hypothetical protein